MLVVEDEIFIADDVATELTALGAHVVGPGSDSQQAMEFIAADEPIDLSVLDTNLQGNTVCPWQTP